MRGFNIANAGYKKKMRRLEKEIEKSQIELKQIPAKVPEKYLLAEHIIVSLETERKMFTDGIKMICYRAESCLYNLVAPFFARNNDEGRAFFKVSFSNQLI